jgi:hypothetical protein
VRPIPGQMTLDVGPKALPTLSKAVTGFAMLGLLGGLTHWAGPTLRASKIEQRRGVWGWLQRALDAMQAFVAHGTNYVGHHVSKGAHDALPISAHTLNLMALRWEQLIWHFADAEHQHQLVTGRLVHHVIPRQINRQTVPIRARQRRLRRGLAVLTQDLNALRHWIRHELNHNVKPRIGRVETKVNHTLPQRIRRGERVQARTQARQRADHKLIIKLLPLLTIAGAVGLVLKAFTRLGLNFLRCENVKGFGNSLCPSPPGSGRGLGRFGGAFGRLLGELAALSFVPFLLTDACRIVGIVEQAAIKVQPEIDALVLGIEGFVCEASDLKRAPAMPSGL